jgi:hypothetical protein
MQYVNDASKSYRIDGAVRIAVEIVDDFQHPGSVKTFQRFRVRCFGPDLRFPQSTANPSFHLLREAAEVFFAAPDPANRPSLDNRSAASRSHRGIDLCLFRNVCKGDCADNMASAAVFQDNAGMSPGYLRETR